MAESQELVLKRMREQAARNALEADKLAAGNEFEDTDFLSRMTSGASGEPSPIQESTIEEMIRDKPTLEESPSARSLTLPTMPTPEQTHEAKKDFVKFAAEDVAVNAALGGAGKVAQAALAFVPAPTAFARHGISKISAAIPEAAKKKFLAGLDELKANNPFAYDNQVEHYQKVFELAEREEARQRLFAQVSKATPEDIVLDIVSEADRLSGYLDRRTINELYRHRYDSLQHARLQDEIRRLPDDLDDHQRRVAVEKLEDMLQLGGHYSNPLLPGSPHRREGVDRSVRASLAKLVDEGKIAESTGHEIVPRARGTMSTWNPGYWVRGSAESPLGALTRESDLLRQDYWSPENLFNQHLKSIDPKGKPMEYSRQGSPAKARVLGEDIVQWPLGGGKYGDPAPPGSLRMVDEIDKPGALSLAEGTSGALSIVDDIPGALSIVDDLKRSN